MGDTRRLDGCNDPVAVARRLELALEAGRMGTWDWDVRTGDLHWDATSRRLFGVSDGDSPIPPELFMQRVHPDDREFVEFSTARLLKERYPIDHEFRIVRSNGEVRWIASRGCTEFEGNEPVRVHGVNFDITDLKSSAELAEQSQKRLSDILLMAADAIISINSSLQISLFNRGAESIFGYECQEVLGRSLDVLLPERFRTAHRKHVQDFRLSSVTARMMGERRELFGLHKDGHEFPAEASISKMGLGQDQIFTVMLRDITQRRRLEEELEARVRNRTAELTAVLDGVPHGIIHADFNHRIIAPNSSAITIFGYERSELVGMFAGRLLANTQDEERVLRAWTELDATHSVRVVDAECRRKDGTTFPCVIFLSPVLDSSGQTKSRIGICQDMTEEIRNRKALSVAQRMEAFGQLAGGIAHDFNNILTVIMGNQELLESQLTTEKQRAHLKRAQNAAEIGARLTERLLTFARRRQLKPMVLNINEQIIDMLELLRRAIGETITLKTNLAAALWSIEADPSDVENAVLNLAINARDAMPKGGTLVVETENCRIEDNEVGRELKLSAGDYVRVTVTDTGTGMAAEILHHAFEPFFTTKQPGKGTGLGLSTIQSFIFQSGGTVTAYSEVGHGTSVSFYLPRVGDHAPKRLRSPSPAIGSGASRGLVLLVEDREDVRIVTRERLVQLGYLVEDAVSGRKAIDILQDTSRGFDIVLSDVVMPGGVSGLDLARWLQDNRPDVHVVLMSGFSEEVATGSEKDRLKVPILRKPFTIAELLSAFKSR